ncbi:hypothetical protein DK37_23325, partial [Halomonas sp. SUBG004]
LDAGDSRRLHYRTYTLNEQPDAHALGKVIRTRHGSAAVPGEADSPSAEQRQFVVDFSGGALETLAADAELSLDISVRDGEALLPQIKVLPSRPTRHVQAPTHPAERYTLR